MRISELVEHLEALRFEHGDLEVVAFAYGDIEPGPVAVPEVQMSRIGSDAVLLESG